MEPVGDVSGRGYLWGVEFTDPETGGPYHDPRVDDWAGTGGGLTPDTRPIIDTLEEDNVVVATGFILFPVAGRAVRALVTGERCPFALDPLSRERF
jgi:glycine/D-amino acid oxidase-like deaminating enzyme